MKQFTFDKGKPPLDNKIISDNLNSFISLYEKRPIKNNIGGMLFVQMFYFYNLLKTLKPDLVIESGVFKGQSTWLIENTLPSSKIISIDINLNQREFISKNASYSNIDFKFHNFSKIPKNTLVLFDDHVNHVERIIEANFFGIKYIVLEDNYPPQSGDFQTLKQIYNNHHFRHNPGLPSLLKSNILFNKIFLKKIFLKNYNAKIDLDKISKRIRDGYVKNDWFENLEKSLECYYEFAPLIEENMSKENQFVKKPIFDEIPLGLNKFLDQIKFYNYMTYIKLI